MPVPGSKQEPTVVVLAVDDYELNAAIMPVLLEPLCVRVVTASSARQALALCDAEEFGLILLDVHLPDIEGPATAALLRQSLRNKETPTLFVTGDDVCADALIEQGLDVLRKPYRAATLLAKVDALLAARRGYWRGWHRG